MAGIDDADLTVHADWDSNITEGALEDAAAVKAFDKAVRQNEKSLKKNDQELKNLNLELDSHKKALDAGTISSKEYDDHLTRINHRMRIVSKSSANLSDAINKGRHDMRQFKDEVGHTERGLHRLERMLTGGGGGGKIGRGIRKLGHAFSWLGGIMGGVFKMMKVGLIGTAVIAGIPLILRAITALGGGIYALGAKWSQATGIILALPAALAFAGGAMGTMMLAIKGLDDKTKKFMVTWGKGLQKVATKAVFTPKTIKGIKDMMDALNPTLKGGLKGIGSEWGRIIRSITGELKKGKTQTLLSEILGTAKTSNGKVENAGVKQQLQTLGTAAVPALKLFLQLVRAGQPVIKEMANDIAGIAKGFSFSSENATSWIARAYTTLKEFGRTVRNFFKGLVNIGKLATGVGGDMTKSLETISQKFLDWTTSPDGKSSITKFFADLKPTLQELGKWVPAIGGALKSITSTNGDFITVSSWLRTQALPGIVNAWTYLKDKFVPVMKSVFDLFYAIGDSTLAKGVSAGIQGTISALTTLFQTIAKLPGGSELMMIAGALGGIFLALRVGMGAIGLGSVPAGVASSLLGVGKATSAVAMMEVGTINAGVLNTGVSGMPGGVLPGGKGGSNNIPGMVGGAATKAGKFARFMKIAGPIGLALAGYEFISNGVQAWNDPAAQSQPGGGLGNTAKYGAGVGFNLLTLGIPNTVKGIAAGVADFQKSGDAMSAISTWWEKGNPLAYESPGAKPGATVASAAAKNPKLPGWNDIKAIAKAQTDAMLLAVRDQLSKSPAAQAEANQALLNKSAYSKTKNYSRYFTDDGSARTRALTNPEMRKLRRLEKDAKRAAFVSGKMANVAAYGTPDERRADRARNGIANDREGIGYWRQTRMAAFRAQHAATPIGIPTNAKTGRPAYNTFGQVPTYGRVADGLKAKVVNAQTKLDTFKKTLDGLTSTPTIVDLQLNLLTSGAVGQLLKLLGIAIPGTSPNPTAGGGLSTSTRADASQVPVVKKFTGGPTTGGLYLTGEQGPELWMGRTGGMRMLGINGPEVLTLGPGAVINAEATRDPFTPRPGLTPQWALAALQTATVRNSQQYQAAAAAGAGSTIEAHVNFGDIHPASGIDLENSIRRGIAKAARDRAERS